MWLRLHCFDARRQASTKSITGSEDRPTTPQIRVKKGLTHKIGNFRGLSAAIIGNSAKHTTNSAMDESISPPKSSMRSHRLTMQTNKGQSIRVMSRPAGRFGANSMLDWPTCKGLASLHVAAAATSRSMTRVRRVSTYAQTRPLPPRACFEQAKARLGPPRSVGVELHSLQTGCKTEAWTRLERCWKCALGGRDPDGSILENSESREKPQTPWPYARDATRLTSAGSTVAPNKKHGLPSVAVSAIPRRQVVNDAQLRERWPQGYGDGVDEVFALAGRERADESLRKSSSSR